MYRGRGRASDTDELQGRADTLTTSAEPIKPLITREQLSRIRQIERGDHGSQETSKPADVVHPALSSFHERYSEAVVREATTRNGSKSQLTLSQNMAELGTLLTESPSPARPQPHRSRLEDPSDAGHLFYKQMQLKDTAAEKSKTQILRSGKANNHRVVTRYPSDAVWHRSLQR